MPDYGVDTPAWAPLPWSWAAQRLVANRNYRVVTVSADGRPHALPVWGVWHDEKSRFAFSSSPRARKVRNVAVNPRSVVMADATGVRRLRAPAVLAVDAGGALGTVAGLALAAL